MKKKTFSQTKLTLTSLKTRRFVYSPIQSSCLNRVNNFCLVQKYLFRLFSHLIYYCVSNFDIKTIHALHA